MSVTSLALALPVVIAAAVAASAALPAAAQRTSAVHQPTEPTLPEPAPPVEPHTLIVEVRDENGELLEEDVPYVMPPEDIALDGTTRFRWPREATRLGPGRWSFHTFPYKTYSVGCFSKKRPLAEDKVQLGASRQETRTTLFLGPEHEPSELMVEVRAPEGISGGMRVSAHSPRTGKQLTFKDGKVEDGRCKMTLELPPGWYTVRATPSTSWLFRDEGKVDLHAGTKREFVLFTELGGRVRFLLDSPPGRRLRGSLSTADGTRVPLTYASISGGAAGLTTVQPLAPGMQEVTLRIGGYEPITARVDVRSGVRRDVRVALE